MVKLRVPKSIPFKLWKVKSKCATSPMFSYIWPVTTDKLAYSTYLLKKVNKECVLPIMNDQLFCFLR